MRTSLAAITDAENQKIILKQ